MPPDAPASLAREGPPLEQLLRRVAEAPADVRAEPRIGGNGRVHVAAVVGDLLAAFGARPDPMQLVPFAPADPGARNRLSVALLLCWLLADPAFAGDTLGGGGAGGGAAGGGGIGGAPRLPLGTADLLRLLDAGARELAATPAPRFVDDPDRREELARVALAALGLRPAGETVAQAEDRLAALSTAERARVVAASRDAERRARAIREALRRKAAEESADKWSRE